MARILVTGAAGFIGAALSERLLDRGDEVIGLDSLTDYYDVALKEARLARLSDRSHFHFHRLDLADDASLRRLFATEPPERVVNLAAQVGVRYSLTNPSAYVQANLVGFGNLLELCRQHGVGHLVFASSSSVYGANGKQPFSTHAGVDHPVSLYAATKKANELMAHSYSHLYALPTTGLRFFTVYGPWGRPDMAPLLFARAIQRGEPIDVFNGGAMRRDFTYVDDVVEVVTRVLDRPAAADPNWSDQAPDPASSRAPYRIYNVGNGQPVELLRFIEVLEQALGRKAERRLQPLQPGDVLSTFADTRELELDFAFRPATPIEAGVGRMVEWVRSYGWR